MLGVLVISLAQHPVGGGGGIAGQLRIFVIKLLSGAAHPHFRAGAVEHMITVERNTILLVAKPAAAAATGTVVASTHALHIHRLVSILVCWLARCGIYMQRPFWRRFHARRLVDKTARAARA
ncbi:hypothetical protein [Acidocella sp. MX-AZ03]|uniref:hypothetical protein n=1 Tax=Acidocella sp. MX-AZ03 TaxID=2697363 RepID=UPI002FD7B5D5